MRCSIVILLLALLWPCSVKAQWNVGDVGDPDTWEIRGTKTFQPDEIRQALRSDLESLIAAHPRALLPELPPVLQDRLAKGYRNSGFPDAGVRASFNRETGRIEIDIIEGTRCQANEIIVTGVTPELSRTISRRLTEKYLNVDNATPEFDQHGQVLNWIGADGEDVAAESPLWTEGKPVSFDPVPLKKLRARVASVFATAGYYDVAFSCDIRPHGALADLVIDVQDLGVPAIVREIDVIGNQVNSDEEIIRHVNIRPGVLFSTERRQQILHTLWQSARFAEHRVAVEPVAGGINLTIVVLDAPKAPPLSEPLSREAEALRKCRNWLVNGPGRERDLVFTMDYKDVRGELIISQSGLLATIGGQGPESVPDYALAMSDKGMGVLELKEERKLLVQHPGMVLTVIMKQRLAGPDEEKPFKMLLALGFEAAPDNMERTTGTKTPLEFKSSTPPAYFVALANVDPGVAKWEGSILTIKVRHGVMRVDEATGELLEHQMFDDDGNVVYSVTSVPGRFEQRQDELRAATASHRDHYDPSAPISSLATFLCTSSLPQMMADLTGQYQEFVQQLGVAKSMVDAGVLAPIDKYVVNDWLQKENAKSFSIPSSSENVGYVAVVGRLGLGLADHLFTRNSWPWTVWREACFAAAGYTKHTENETRQLLSSDDVGPLGHWVLAEVFANLQNDAIATVVAARGTTRLDAAQFRGDTEAVFAKLQEPLAFTAGWVSRLDALGRRELARELGVEAELIDQAARSIHAAPDGQVVEASLDVLDQLWTSRWRGLAKSRLEKIITESGATALQAQKKAAGKQ